MSHYLKGNVHIPETGGRTSLFLTCLTSSSSSHNYCTSKPCDSLGPTGQVCSGFWKFLTIYAHLILNRETNSLNKEQVKAHTTFVLSPKYFYVKGQQVNFRGSLDQLMFETIKLQHNNFLKTEQLLRAASFNKQSLSHMWAPEYLKWGW